MNEHNISQDGMCDISDFQRAEKLQKALYLISETANLAINLEEFYYSVHEIIGELIPAKNLYIAIYDEVTDTVHFPYYIDEIYKKPDKRKSKRGTL